MKTRPIIFNGDMVRALLDGRKTQTRRVIKPQPPEDTAPINGPEMYEPVTIDKHGEQVPGAPIFGIYDDDGEWGIKCPYGQPDDLLWVRETFQEFYASSKPPTNIHEAGIRYKADRSERLLRVHAPRYGGNIRCNGVLAWRPSIHMPRWASRITLRITDVRVQRVQNISEDEAEAEGVEPIIEYTPAWGPQQTPHWFAYMKLWDSINANRGYAWQSNPWVWALTFEVIHQNVDQVLQKMEAA